MGEEWTFPVRISSRIANGFSQFSVQDLKEEFASTAADGYQEGDEGNVDLGNGQGYSIDLARLVYKPDVPSVRALQEKSLFERAKSELITEHNSDLPEAFNPENSAQRLKNFIAESQRVTAQGLENGDFDDVPTDAQVKARVARF